MTSFNQKFIEKIQLLGEIEERSDDNIYLVLKPQNNKAAQLIQTPLETINLTKMKVDSYEPLVLWTDPNGIYENLSEKESLDILLSLHDGLGWD